MNGFKNEPSGTIDTKISKELNMYTNYAKLWKHYHIYGINLRYGLRYTDFSAWLYDIYERTMASKRKFREAKSAEEENKMFDNAIPRSTRSVTKWTIKILNEW